MSRGLLTFMATVTHLALVVLTIGLLFYVTDDDVIVERDAGTTLGPAMVFGSMAAVFFVLARSFGVAGRDGESRAPAILRPSLLAAVGSYVVMLLIGSLLYALRRDEAVWLVLFAGRYAGSAFVIVSSVWAGVVVAGFLLLARFESARAVRDAHHDDL
ncbi:hypothetical protein GCM10025867_13080 [Frondihabitans sucicola]|uniref:DUF2975 domain-containing protein n=1 Tax=Frondihabitans sucicola TaxID=1268041 RepID=A0ABM8GL12_9MICO|nr:DUF6121 family protein [Frondihabitans sucicola]BDZ49067.1 hypothetical protein GCM10025867_13080 [Frondihabitans sucicola]